MNHLVIEGGYLLILLMQQMEKMELITRKNASQLLKMHEQINKPGSGVVYYSEDLLIDESEQYVCAVACSIDHLKSGAILTQINESISLCLCIKQDHIQSLSVFLSFFDKVITPMLEKSNQISKRLKVVMLDIPTHQNRKQLVLILRQLQFKAFSIILNLLIDSNNWQEYQKNLCLFSLEILEQEYVMISTTAVILRLPDFVKNNPSDYLKILLTVWRRCLPAGLGGIIIEDWLNPDKNVKKPILGMHLIKNLQLCWKLQFITHHLESCESLGGQCLGID